MNTKICSKCKLELTLNDFHKDKSSRDGLQQSCKKCKKDERKKYIEKIKDKNSIKNPYSNPDKLKFCSYCKLEKNITDFAIKKDSVDGVYTWCKNCVKIYSREWINKNKETNKNKNYSSDDFKICSKCKLELSKDNFRINTSRKNGLNSYCNNCEKLKNEKIYNKNKNKNTNPYSNQTKIKICKTCKLEKNILDFNIIKRNSDGLSYNCRECENEHKRKRKNNQTEISKEKSKIRMKKYREKISKNPIYKISTNISRGISHSLKNGKDRRHWENLVGYTVEELKIHLEKQFKEGMNWENYGLKGWHIDHIKPISSFNFKSYEDEEFKKCWSLENLQPLWAKDNLRKSNKISEEYGNL